MQPQGYEGESTGFIPIANSKGTVKSPKDKFLGVMALEQQKAQRKRLPFAWATASADLADIQRKYDLMWKRQGFIDEDYTVPKMDWSKYSDLKNFELIDEHERNDENLTNRHKVQVFIKAKKYKFKGFNQTYTIMEDGIVALERALSKK